MVVDEPLISVVEVLCQDCDSPVSISDADVAMGGMEDDASGGDPCRCRSCHRTVCDNCAVVETGEGRECLQCRTSVKKTWVGGIGWMP